VSRVNNRTARQHLSMLAFGGEHVLDIAAHLDSRPADLHIKKDVAEATGISDSTVYRVLRDLEELGVLSSHDDGGRTWYVVADHERGPFWVWVRALVGGPTPTNARQIHLSSDPDH
jgi:DNA-binding transcriptional ArsR family regulator